MPQDSTAPATNSTHPIRVLTFNKLRAPSCASRHRHARVLCARTTLACLDRQPAVKVRLHSAGAASRLAALLLAQILPVFSLVTPCQPGASPPSVQRQTFITRR